MVLVAGVCGSGVFALVAFDFFFVFLLDLIDFLFDDLERDRFNFFFCPDLDVDPSSISVVTDRLRSLIVTLSPALFVVANAVSGGGDVERAVAVDPEYSETDRVECVLADFARSR